MAVRNARADAITYRIDGEQQQQNKKKRGGILPNLFLLEMVQLVQPYKKSQRQEHKKGEIVG